jgi:RNA polymerase sigma-70 factor (ECF subfamily)
MELTDLAFVAKARLGDADAFRALVERHGRPLFRLAFRMTGNQHDAEDVVQESFLRAWRQLGKFDERASFGTWLYRIATNCSLDVIRSRKRRSKQEAGPEAGLSEMEDPVLSLPSGDPTPDRLAMSGQVRECVAEAMNELSASERTAFVLRHFEGMRIEDVSRVLGCQPGAAKHSVFRAVQKLRRALEPFLNGAR